MHQQHPGRQRACPGSRSRGRSARQLAPEDQRRGSALTATASAGLPAEVGQHVATGPSSTCAATISTGGAAKGVSVPPIETFTNRTPSVAYLSLFDTPAGRSGRCSISAASVIAAGSVMNDPSSGTRDSVDEVQADGPARAESARDGRHAAARQLQDRPAAGDDHDREDEHRLGVVARVEIARSPSACPEKPPSPAPAPSPRSRRRLRPRRAGARCRRGAGARAPFARRISSKTCGGSRWRKCPPRSTGSCYSCFWFAHA